MQKPEETYRNFARYYDIYVTGFTGDLEMYRKFCKSGENILEIGCGTGRILEFLLKEGHQITGVDISNEMLDIAKNKLRKYVDNNQLVLLNHDFSVKSLDKKYNKVLITFYTINYIIENPDKFLVHVYQSMVKNSEILIDLFYPESLKDRSINGKWINKKFKDLGKEIELRDKRIFDGIFEKRIQIYEEKSGKIVIETIRKYYSPDQIKGILESAGFKEIYFSKVYCIDNFRNKLEETEIESNFIVRALKQ